MNKKTLILTNSQVRGLVDMPCVLKAVEKAFVSYGKNSQEITLFDSTGLAIQDVAVADLVYKRALKKRIGSWVRFWE